MRNDKHLLISFLSCAFSSPSVGMAHPTGLGLLAQSCGWMYEGGYVLCAGDDIHLQVLVPVYVCLPQVRFGHFLIQKLSPFRGPSNAEFFLSPLPPRRDVRIRKA